MKLYSKLMAVQSKLAAPKGQFNSFGKYKYRNCEDILEALKPLLQEQGLAILISDDIESIGNRFYVRATVTIFDVETGESMFNSALAREEESKKGMDGSQVTGASSSYARKYALNGMFAIDDTKDSDSTNTHGKEETKPTPAPKQDWKESLNIPAEWQEKVVDVEEEVKLISVPQAKRLFAIAKGNEQMLRGIIESFGYTSSKEIKLSDYESIVKKIENGGK